MADDYFDKSNRHEVYLHRTGTSLVNQYAIPNLQSVYKDARAILLDAEEIKSVSQLNKIQKAVAKEIVPQTELMWNAVTQELEDLAVFEAAFYAKLVGDVAGVDLDVPADKKVIKYIYSAVMKLEGSKLDEWEKFTKQNAQSIVDVYSNEIRKGFEDNKSVFQISKQLKAKTNKLLLTQADALTRTGLSHYTINAREAMAQDNSDVITGRYYNAVFDNRTTLICRGHADDKDNPWALDDKSAPSIPAHFNCRSNWLFMVNGQDRPEGTKAAVGGKKGEEAEERFDKRENALNKRRDNPNITGKTSSKVRYRGRKDNDTFKAGQVSGATTADSFLRGQPRWFIESALGKKRAALFIDKKINITKFTDMTGRPLTLAELKASGI